jgi:hypothetical protein
MYLRIIISSKKMNNLGNCKNSVGLKPNAELRKDAEAPSIPINKLSKIECSSQYG